jgi:hypothetical protein
VIVRALLSTALLVVSCMTRPSRSRCPDGWYVGNGVRPSGRFECVQAPARGEYDCSADRVCPQPKQDAAEVAGQIVCTGGATPIVSDSMNVGCMRRFE